MHFVKYPRTLHLPFSPGCSSDDKVIENLDGLKGRMVVVTEKMDGENFTLYSTGVHARSTSSVHHPSRSWIKQFHSTIAHYMPKDIRVCGENLFAKHSILYKDLLSYFYGFSVWNKQGIMSVNDTTKILDGLHIPHVPIMYSGPFDEGILKDMADRLDTQKHEGFVVRVMDAFPAKDFQHSVAKWVRKQHVTTAKHWMHAPMVQNELKK